MRVRIPGSRAVAGATAVGFGLRLAWVSFAARPPVRLSDPWHYQQIATAFSQGRTMVIGEHATAFYPPGYAMALAPLAWFSRHVGGVDLPMAAALLNVVAGTATIVGVAALARAWIGVRAGDVAAWAMALAPAQILLSSTALAETLFTATSVGVVVLLTRAVDRRWSPVRFGLVGVLVGYSTLIRSPGLLALAAVPLIVRARGGRWGPAWRPFLAVTAGAVAVLAPWGIRNAVEVGVATPMSTNNAAFLCLDNRPGADGLMDQSLEESRRCFRRSPMDNPTLYRPEEIPAGWRFEPVDEPGWYRRTIDRTVTWMAEHPSGQPRLMARRLAFTFRADTQALNDAEGFGTQPLVGPAARRWLDALANAWLWSVLALSAIGLLLVRRCRRAVPIWALIGLMLVPVLLGPALDRYHHPIVPLLVVLAAGALVGRDDTDEIDLRDTVDRRAVPAQRSEAESYA